MNRPFRFRAWDKTNNRMMYFSSFWACDEYQSLAWRIDDDSKIEGESDYCLDWEEDTLEIMQFTGLHDKNGVEIFTGDIVQSEQGSYGQIKIKEVVEIKKGLLLPFYSMEAHDHDVFDYKVDNYEYEVLGNIYEHGDLLNGKD